PKVIQRRRSLHRAIFHDEQLQIGVSRRQQFGGQQNRNPEPVHGLPTVIVGLPIVIAGVVIAAAVCAVGAPLLPRAASAPATAPPPTSASTVIHRPRCLEIFCAGLSGVLRVLASAALPPSSVMYWKETIPARACSLEAMMRICKRPAARFHRRLRRLARPRSSPVTTSVLRPLGNIPLGPSSGR